MRHPQLARGSGAAVSLAAAGLVLAALGAAGCSPQQDTSRASVESCVQFGMAAIRQHVTVTSLPPACQGLTAAQIDAAAGTALRSAASGVRGKAQRRQRVVRASRYLAHMFVALPAPRSAPPLPSPAAHWVGRTTLSLIAVGTWLVTVALGLSLLARRIPRGRARRGPAGRFRLPALNLVHMGLAAVSLLTWIVYLATATTGIAWAAAGLLPLVAGFGMAILFLPYRTGPEGGVAAAPPLAGDGARAAGDSAPSQRAPVLVIGAHVIFATATILFAVLAAIGTG